MEKSCEECLRYFNSGGEGGFNCAESTVYGLTTILDIPANDLIRIATPFGGGLSRNGYICGSLLMGILFLGYRFGRENPNASRVPAYQAADTLVQKFRSKYGAIDCRELTGLDLKRIDNTGEEKQRVHETVCRPIVVQVCQWVREIVETSSSGPRA
ncbi:MAG: C-GCAxxG-C-C family protein [Spirochaetes bacterium]|nr:C-GCAxxG-C-C family protein [Spirochaetota bacterium]